MRNRRRASTVAILGPFGWGNLGDAAIQDAVLAQLRLRRADVHIVGVSLVPTDTEQRHGIETYAYDADTYARRRTGREAGRFREALRRRLPRMHRILHELAHTAYAIGKLRRVDLLVVSGGGQLDEFWGGPWHHPFALLKWSALARLTRARVAFLSVGAGTSSSRLSKLFLRGALRLAHYRSYRDAGSQAIVRDQIEYSNEDPVVPDMAFGLPVRAPARAQREELVIAVGPMAYGHPAYWPQPDKAAYERYVDTLARLCDRLVRQGARLKFFVGEISHDPPVIRDVNARLAAGNAGEGLDAPGSSPRMESVEALLACLSEADIVIASRFHGVLLALLLRKPVLALSYERKVRQLMRDLGQGAFCVDIEQADFDLLARMFADLETHRHTVSEELNGRVQRETEAVLAQFDQVVATLLPAPASRDTTAVGSY